MGTTYTLSGDFSDLLGDEVDTGKISAYVRTNLPAGTALIDTTATADSIRLGNGKITVAADGTFSVTLLGTANTGLNVAANTLRYEVVAEYVNRASRGRSTWRSGFFELTANSDLKTLTTDVEPMAAVSASGYALEAKGYRDEAAASAAAVEARVVEDLGTTDAQTKALIESPTSQTATALSATIEAGVSDTANAAYDKAKFSRALHIRPGKDGVVGNGTGDDTAAIQAILNQVSPALGVLDVVIHDGTYMIDAVNEAATTYYNGVTSPAATRGRYQGGGIKPKKGTRLTMAPDAILKVITNGSPGYAAISLNATQSDVQIRGGQILGDRATHDYLTEPTYTSHEYGFGIALIAVTDVVIEGVKISGCTGDGIFLENTGNLLDEVAYGPYVPCEHIVVRRCRIDGSRRNNISVTACDNVLIEGNLITRAGYDDGIKDGVAPRLGLDIEGSGDAGTDWQTPLNVIVRGNRFTQSHVNGSMSNYNGYGVVIEGNFADGTVAFGFATETIIRGNVIKNLSNTTSPGIASNSFASAEVDANCVIEGNCVMGFATGIQVQRDQVLVANNFVSKFQAHGVNTSTTANGVTIVGNRIVDGQGASTCNGVTVSATDTVVQNNTIRNVRTGVLLASTATAGNTIGGNHVSKAILGVNVSGGSQAVIKGNVFDLAGHAGGQSYDITYANTSVVLIEGNVFRNSSAYSVNGACSTGKSRIIGNRIVDSSAINQINLAGAGKHEVIGNVISVSRTSAGTGVIVIAGGSVKSLVMSNTAYRTNTQALGHLVNTVTNGAADLRVIGNTVETSTGTGSLITGTTTGTTIETGNVQYAA